MPTPRTLANRLVAALSLVLAVSLPAIAQNGAAAYRALGLVPQEVLAGTVLTAKVLPGDEKQVVCVATYLTGKRERDQAFNVRLGVFRREQGKLVPLYTRDFGEDGGVPVGNGDLVLLDLDLDGISEIVVSFDDFGDPLLEQRRAEVIVHDGSGFRPAWNGLLEYDATKAARDVPETRRDRFVREFDWPSTLRAHGETLYVNKTMIAVAGERLAEPKVLQESFPLLR